MCNFMPFDGICNKKSFFLSCCLLFCCLSAFEYHSGCFWSIWVLLWCTIMSSVNLVNDKFFLSCAIYNNSAMAQCERISLKSVRCTVPLWKVASSVISAVLAMERNRPLRSHAMLSRPTRPCFTIVNLFKGPPSSSFLPYLYPLALSLCKTLASRVPPPLSPAPSNFCCQP
jgi:hypothetical protein